MINSAQSFSQSVRRLWKQVFHCFAIPYARNRPQSLLSSSNPLTPVMMTVVGDLSLSHPVWSEVVELRCLHPVEVKSSHFGLTDRFRSASGPDTQAYRNQSQFPTIMHYSLVFPNVEVRQPKTLGWQDPATDPCLKVVGSKWFARDSNRGPLSP